MLWDAIRGYMQLATGVTEATTDRAKEVAQGLLSAVGLPASNELGSQVSGMAEEVLNAARTQRDSLVALVRTEVTTVVESSGLAKRADVDTLTSRLSQVAADVEALVSQLPGGSLTPAGIRTRRRAEAGEAPPEAFEKAAVASDVEQPDSSEQAPARKTAARKTAPGRKTTGASSTRATSARKAAAAKKTASADEATSAPKTGVATTTSADTATSPRKTASARTTASADTATSPRKTASARRTASADTTTSPRKTASPRKTTSARKGTSTSRSQAPDTATSDAAQAASEGSDNG